jgi:hypothetical protein
MGRGKGRDVAGRDRLDLRSGRHRALAPQPGQQADAAREIAGLGTLSRLAADHVARQIEHRGGPRGGNPTPRLAWGSTPFTSTPVAVFSPCESSLREKGKRGWIVGGCVRDLLRGAGKPKDWDIATDARRPTRS